MKKTIFAAFVSLLIFTGGTNAFAVHKKLTNEDQKHLAITIYNNNIALVKDRRSVHLKKGINRLSFSDISAKIIPNSALIRRESPKPSFKVIEQAFRYEQLTPKSLLEASVGQEVFIDLGHEPIQSGRLVSVHGGILVSIKGKMREVKEHQLLFPQVPHELATNPELTLKLECSETAAASMELSYLTTGLSWEASYIGEISADGSTIDLGSWVTLTNTTSSDYSDANLQLVAADVTWGASFHGKGQEKGIPHAFEAIRLLGFPMYGLSHRVSLRGHEVKQVSLLSLQQVKLTREFLVQGTKEYLFKDMTGRALPAQVETWLSFSNTEEIGAPLPKGIIRLYKRDPKGHVQFVGEDFIDHTLPKGKITLRLGAAQDVDVSLTQSDFKMLGQNVCESGYHYTFTNSQDRPIQIKLKEEIPYDFRMLRESIPNESKIKNQLVWIISLEPKETKHIRFRLRVSKQG